MRWHDEVSTQEYRWEETVDKNYQEDFDEAISIFSSIFSNGIIRQGFLSMFLWACKEDQQEAIALCDEIGLTKRHIYALQDDRKKYQEELYDDMHLYDEGA